MNNFLYRQLRKCFKSDRHIRRFIRLLGYRAFYPGGLEKVMLQEQMEEAIDGKLTDVEIALKLDIDRKRVYRFRQKLWNLKRK